MIKDRVVSIIIMRESKKKFQKLKIRIAKGIKMLGVLISTRNFYHNLEIVIFKVIPGECSIHYYQFKKKE